MQMLILSVLIYQIWLLNKINWKNSLKSVSLFLSVKVQYCVWSVKINSM